MHSVVPVLVHHILLPDDGILNLGNSRDLKLFHDGSNSNITNTTTAFYYCRTLKQAPPISGTISNAQQMFQNCRNLEKIPAYDLSGCNSGNETYLFKRVFSNW